MLRYGRDYGRWNGQGRYDRDRPGGYGPGLGGPRNDEWGVPRHSFPGEGAWMGDSVHMQPGYDYDYGGGFGSGYSGYGGDYFSGRGGAFGGRGMGQQGRGYAGSAGRDSQREMGYGQGGFGYGGYEGGMQDFGGGRRPENGAMGMRAADIMTDNPEAVSPDTSLSEVAQKMRDLDVGIIPVVDDAQNRRLRGVITDRDITIRATAEGKDARSTRVSEVMTPRVQSVNKNDPVRNVLNLMQREQVKRVPVTDREGRLVGIIAEADLLNDYEGRDKDRLVEQTLERVYETQPARGQGEMRGSSASEGSVSSTGGAAAGRGRKGTETRE